MSSSTANAAYTKLENTIVSAREISSSVTELGLSGVQPAISSIDSTSAVEVVLTTAQLQQAVISQLLLDHDTGSNAVNLYSLATSDSTANSRAAQLQAALKLNVVGAVASLNILRSGSGTGAVTLEGVTIMSASQDSAQVKIEATNVTASSETNAISVIAQIPDAYVESTWTPAITGSTSGGATATVDTANYSQIGNRVFFTLKLSSIADDSMVGNVQISLPVAVAAGENPSFTIGNIEPFTYADVSGEQVIARSVAGTSVILLQAIVTGAATAAITHADFFGSTSVTDLQISGSYVV